MTQPINEVLLNRIGAIIVEHYDNFNMNEFSTGTMVFDKNHPPSCGTACCIAGWAVAITHGVAQRPVGLDGVGEFVRSAAESLGINADQAERLFYTCSWPPYFASKFNRASTRKARAEVAAARIEHFIETNGEE